MGGFKTGLQNGRLTVEVEGGHHFIASGDYQYRPGGIRYLRGVALEGKEFLSSETEVELARCLGALTGATEMSISVWRPRSRGGEYCANTRRTSDGKYL